MRTSRIRVVEIIVAVSVVVISVASLFVAVYQGIVMQRTLEAQVLPVIQYGTGDFDSEREEWRMRLALTNTGLGPAEIRHFALYWNDAPISDTSAFLAACCASASVPDDQRLAYMIDLFRAGEMRLFFDGVDGRFFAPQESVEFVTFEQPDPELQPRGYAVWMALDRIRHQIEVEVCYCSVFDDCWHARFPEQAREPVRSCPARD